MPTDACQCPGSRRWHWKTQEGPGPLGVPRGLRLWSWGAVRMGTWVMVSLPQGWPGAAGAHPGRLPSGPDGPGDNGEMALRWPEPGLARHSHRWQGQAGGALGGLGDSSLCWPWPPALLWEGRAVLLPCTVRGPELAPGGGKDVRGRKGDFFSQSQQWQRGCADCRGGLGKERRKTSALQEEKLELQKVSALLAFLWAQGRIGGTVGESTSLVRG